MKKIVIYIFAYLIFLTSCQEGTVTPIVPPKPQPTEKDSVWGDYFINTAGSEWEYNVSVNSKFSHIAYIKIEKRLLIKKTLSVALWSVSEKSITSKHYKAIIGDSVFVFSDINDLNNPQKILKQFILPLNQYRSWDVRTLAQDFGNDKASGGSDIGTVTVTAGKYDNVLEIERITDAKDRKAHEWIQFVPGVGIIYIETLDISTNTTTVWELRKKI